ncbi:MAG: TetR/AcrR family transcriptional regulator [Candidatus Binatia bacterium]
MPTAVSVPQLAPPHRGRPPIAGLRANVLRAAEQIFTSHDYHEVLMEDVARASGVGKGTLYRYFPSKHALYLAVMFEGIKQLHDDLHAAIDTPATPVCKIEHIVRCILAHFWERRFFFALIHHNEHKPDDPDNKEWMRRRAELSRIIQHAIKEAIAAGHVRRIDPRIATEMLLGMLRGANRYRSSHDTLDAMVAAVTEVFVCGAGTPAGRRLIPNGHAEKR